MNKKEDRREIVLTSKNNTTTSGIPFPKTPNPEIRYDGIFPEKHPFLKHLKNKLKRH